MTRLAAWGLLRSAGMRPLSEVNRVADERDFDSRDRALLRRLVGTSLRRRGTLRALVQKLARGKPSPDITVHLHIGFVQLFFLDRVPDHAAVSETVRAVADSVGLSKGRYVNAVLRSAIRARREGVSGDPRCDIVGRDVHFAEPVFRDPATHPHLWAEDALSIPAALMKRWSKRHGPQTAQQLAEYFLEEPRLSLRVVRGSRDEHLAQLESLDGAPQPGSHPSMIVCPSNVAEAAVSSEAFQSGALTVQGESALRAAELVGATESERVLDLCAAPGGKTAVLAASGAHVTACDVSAGRLQDLASTLARLGLADGVRLLESDGTAAVAEERFDAVLVDAPCSNTAVLGARPAARWRFGPKSRASLRAIQERLLAEAAACVDEGGRLVWSTCSLEPEENEQLVRAFLQEHPAFELADEQAALPSDEPGGPVDGGYAARLIRR